MFRIRADHLESDLAAVLAAYGNTTEGLWFDFEDSQSGYCDATGGILGSAGCTLTSYTSTRTDAGLPSGSFLKYEKTLSGAVAQIQDDTELVASRRTSFLTSPAEYQLKFRPESESLRSISATLPISALDRYLATSEETRAGSPRFVTLDAHKSEPDGPLSGLAKYLLDNFEGIIANPRLAQLSEALLVETYVDLLRTIGYVQTLAPAGPRLAANRGDAGARIVHRAEDFIRANFDEPLTMPQVAQAAGVDVRRLQMAFREQRDMTPRQYLSMVRLENARTLLMHARGATNVTVVAYDCGVAHLGRFARAYFEAYGEKPLETLQRSRRRAS